MHYPTSTTPTRLPTTDVVTGLHTGRHSTATALNLLQKMRYSFTAPNSYRTIFSKLVLWEPSQPQRVTSGLAYRTVHNSYTALQKIHVPYSLIASNIRPKNTQLPHRTELIQKICYCLSVSDCHNELQQKIRYSLTAPNSCRKYSTPLPHQISAENALGPASFPCRISVENVLLPYRFKFLQKNTLLSVLTEFLQNTRLPYRIEFLQKIFYSLTAPNFCRKYVRPYFLTVPNSCGKCTSPLSL